MTGSDVPDGVGVAAFSGTLDGYCRQMAIRWSRIHAELGLPPAPLTHDMVTQAVDQRIRENEDLDWKKELAWKKQALPPEIKEEKKQEFAKDVAAMANTRTDRLRGR